MSRQPAFLPSSRYNEQLETHVHPREWKNPKPAERYNLVVIGGGKAGWVTATGAARLGAKVALVEKHMLGGHSLNVGCIPSQSMLRSANAASAMREAGEYGVLIDDTFSVDFHAVMERMRRLRAELSASTSVQRLLDLGIDVFFGDARFESPHSIRVDNDTISFKKAVIATGASPIALPIEGLQNAGFLTLETVFSLTTLPQRLLVVGAGTTGCEMAQAFQRFGSQVILVDSRDSIIQSADREGAAVVRRSLENDGVKIHLRTTVRRITNGGSSKIVELATGNQEEPIDVDEVLLTDGWKPNVDDLQLEKAGVYFDGRKGVQVDDHLRTTNPNIYAAGDVCLRHRLTHTADASGRIVIRNALFRGRRKFSTLHIPECTYTDPEIAYVGLNEYEAEQLGHRVKTYTVYLTDNDRARLDNDTAGFVRIHVEKNKDRILGATIVSKLAGELISDIVVAMTGGMGLRKLASVALPSPTVAEAIREVSHQYLESRLSPLAANLLKRWLAWRS